MSRQPCSHHPFIPNDLVLNPRVGVKVQTELINVGFASLSEGHVTSLRTQQFRSSYNLSGRSHSEAALLTSDGAVKLGLYSLKTIVLTLHFARALGTVSSPVCFPSSCALVFNKRASVQVIGFITYPDYSDDYLSIEIYQVSPLIHVSYYFNGG